MSGKQHNSQPLGKPVEDSSDAGSTHSTSSVKAAQNLALNMGQQVRDASFKVGVAAAPYIAQQSMDGLMDGLNQGFSENPTDIFQGFQLNPDPSVFMFPTGKNAQLSASKQPRRALGAAK